MSFCCSFFSRSDKPGQPTAPLPKPARSQVQCRIRPIYFLVAHLPSKHLKRNQKFTASTTRDPTPATKHRCPNASGRTGGLFAAFSFWQTVLQAGSGILHLIAPPQTCGRGGWVGVYKRLRCSAVGRCSTRPGCIGPGHLSKKWE